MKVTFQLINSRYESIQDDETLEVSFVPREGEKVDLFGRNGNVVGVRHEFASSGRRDGSTLQTVTVTVQAI